MDQRNTKPEVWQILAALRIIGALLLNTYFIFAVFINYINAAVGLFIFIFAVLTTVYLVLIAILFYKRRSAARTNYIAFETMEFMIFFSAAMLWMKQSWVIYVSMAFGALMMLYFVFSPRVRSVFIFRRGGCPEAFFDPATGEALKSRRIPAWVTLTLVIAACAAYILFLRYFAYGMLD